MIAEPDATPSPDDPSPLSLEEQGFCPTAAARRGLLMGQGGRPGRRRKLRSQTAPAASAEAPMAGSAISARIAQVPPWKLVIEQCHVVLKARSPANLPDKGNEIAPLHGLIHGCRR
jgi:hypothetical protein